MKWFLLLITFFTYNTSFSKTGKLEEEVLSLMNEYGAIGVSVAVVKDGDVVFTHSYGYKDLENFIPLHDEHLFRIASVSKTFVATAIMQLVEKGKLSLDDDVNNFLDFEVRNPYFPQKPITIKMLLSHRSSITDGQKWDTFDRINSLRNSDYNKCYGDFMPGSKYVYCNMNYNLLGAVIEKVSRKRFDQYVDRYIVKPLHLNASFNGLRLSSDSFVKSYRYNKGKDMFSFAGDVFQPKSSELIDYRLGYSTTVFSPPAGMIISAGELAEYMIMHMNGGKYKRKRLFSEESAKILHEIPEPKNHYALSISHYKTIIDGEELLGQTGGHLGFHTAMIFHPEKKYGFVVLCNGCKSDGADGHELNFGIIRLLYYNLVNQN